MNYDADDNNEDADGGTVASQPLEITKVRQAIDSPGVISTTPHPNTATSGLQAAVQAIVFPNARIID